MVVRVGINGFGRIGRVVLRGTIERGDTAFEVVAINDLPTPDTLGHLLALDSTYGPWSHTVSVEGKTLVVDGRTIAVTAQANPSKLDWRARRRHRDRGVQPVPHPRRWSLPGNARGEQP